jgi:outer membrane protein W
MVVVATLTTTKSNAQEGRIIVDGYYGYGSFYNAIFKAMVSGDASSKFKGLGPMGVRGEYMLSDKVGFGLDLAYTSSSIEYTETYTEYDENFNTVSTTYDASLKTAKLGAMVTFNYHFVNTDKFDSYFVFGFGYGNRSFTAKSDYIGYESPEYNSTFPVASRLGVGMRYFFTDNLGLNLGLGLGQGGMLNAGVSARF